MTGGRICLQSFRFLHFFSTGISIQIARTLPSPSYSHPTPSPIHNFTAGLMTSIRFSGQSNTQYGVPPYQIITNQCTFPLPLTLLRQKPPPSALIHILIHPRKSTLNNYLIARNSCKQTCLLTLPHPTQQENLLLSVSGLINEEKKKNTNKFDFILLSFLFAELWEWKPPDMMPRRTASCFRIG